MSLIDRVRYYDGEFLRAFDFGDEQTYHLEMRRRLNRYLHLYGIVRGLDLSESTDGGVTQITITPGVAIDAFGREIYVFAGYTLGDADVTANRLTATTYDVWLRYNKTPSTPPSAGYGVCNQANQYTRWTESFSVVLLQSPSAPFTNPAFTDQDSDDPSQDGVGVFLGTVQVNPASPTAQFYNPQLDKRHFLGLIAQRIHAPFGYDAPVAASGGGPLPILTQQGPRHPPVSLEIEPNIFAGRNLILGQDFDMTGANTTFKASTPTQTTGNAKIAGNLFVQGNIYSNTTDPKTGFPVWIDIPSYISQLVQQSAPDVQVGVATVSPVPVTANAGAYASASTPISVTSALPKVSTFVSFAFVSQFEFDTQTNVNSLGGAQVQLSINSVVPTLPPSGNNCTTNVTWIAGPATGVFSAIANFQITAVFICFP
jgi:hypothetical protein